MPRVNGLTRVSFAAVSRVYLWRRPILGLAALAWLKLAAPVGAEEAEQAAAEEVGLERAPGAHAEPLAQSAPEPEPALHAAAELTPPQISALELQTLALVNGARMSRGLPPLEWDHTMAEAARGHAADMATRGVVSHQGSDGSSPNQRLRRAGVQFRFGSENIWTYWGRIPERGPSTMHAAMMAEPHAPGLWNHIGNILYTGYRRIGIGIVTAPNGVQYLSEKFAD